jgi:uncharacterized protein
MPPEVGLFLARTRRMHPDVASYISDIAYDGRLTAHTSTHDQRVLPMPGRREALSGTGLRWVPVHHTGCSQSSAEEAHAVVDVVRDLVGRRWVGPDGEQALDETDVLVVSPYNAQVATLRAALDAAGLRAVAAGTVDKFQGKEAAAVVYSTAASDAETAPRGAAFVADVHRVNVAISRARCLAVLVGSPRLLDARVTTTAAIRPLDVLCRFVASAQAVLMDPPQQGGGDLR